MIIRHFTHCLALLMLMSCANGSSVLSGEKRTPINVSQVEIYRSPPDVKYDYVGTVKSQTEEIFSKQEALDRALEELKRQAAEIGAIGIIFNTMEEKPERFISYTPNMSGGGFFHTGQYENKYLFGEAIYIEQNDNKAEASLESKETDDSEDMIEQEEESKSFLDKLLGTFLDDKEE